MAERKGSLQQPLLSNSEASRAAAAFSSRHDAAYRVPSFADGFPEAPARPTSEGQGIAAHGEAVRAEGAQHWQVESSAEGKTATRNLSGANKNSLPRRPVGASFSGAGPEGIPGWEEEGNWRWGGGGDGRWGELGALDEEPCGTPMAATTTTSGPEQSTTPLSVRSGMGYDDSAGPSTHAWKTLLDTSPSRNARQLSVHLSHQADADIVVLTPHQSEISCESLP